ncbi:MAG: AAA family ATPase [Lachnospiraceae bacterium]|nr:AAA family ATPase [Lachnospiraceae bacterium]
MKKFAIYGKGGIGKSTTASNLSAAISNLGKKVMQIGCDPKADSTILITHGEKVNTTLDLIREKKDAFELLDMVRLGYNGIICAEAGGPTPGLGCAGRGIICALEKLEEKGAYKKYKPDVVFYDVLGDVVCGGFSMPMRKGYADKVFVITSGENMSIYAAANICIAMRNFKDRGYASLGGIILNKKNVKDEEKKVKELCKEFKTKIIGVLPYDEMVHKAEDMQMTVVEAFPDSSMAKSYIKLAKEVLNA